MMKKLSKADVVITHCPPKGVNDDDGIHQGWEAMVKYVKKNKPNLLIHGHTYPDKENFTKRLFDTKIEYVQGYKIIEIEV